MNFPNEILNLIFSFRENHPIAKILKPYIEEYHNSADNGDYYFSFKELTLENLLAEKLNKSKKIIESAKISYKKEFFNNYGFIADYKTVNYFINEIKNKITSDWHDRSIDFKIKEGISTYID
jgi:hypothetical protein